MRRILVSVVVAVLCAVPATSFAQEPSRVGLTLGGPASLGLVIPLGDNVALRPEASFSRASAKFEGPFVVNDSSTSTNLSGGLSALFYVKSIDKLRTYFSPRVAYSRSTTSTSDAKGRSYSAAGSFGAELSLHDRFAVFGELGLAWSRSKSESTSGVTSSRTTTWSTRTGIGAIFYF